MAEEAILRNFQLVYALERAPMAASILHLGAHPDDEDAGMVALMSRGHGARVVYWSATRGEGAQNFVGPDKNERLGIVRTWESLAAREYDGGEVLYGPFKDFGYTKTGEFALAKWGHDAVIREVVRAIRWTQPTVVVNRWAGSPDDGHGHHQAVGLISQDAFDAAADPKRFPDLGLPSWTAMKLYHSMDGDWQPGEDVTLGAIVPEYEQRGLLRLNAGASDPVSGHTFQELAWKGYNRHQSQAMGFVPERGDYHYYYSLDCSRVEASESREASFFDNIDVSLSGVPKWPGLPGARVEEPLSLATAAARSALDSFHPSDPTRSVPALIEALAALRDGLTILASCREPGTDALATLLKRKERDLEWAAARCLGMDLETTVTGRLVHPGGSVGVSVRLRRESGDVDLQAASLDVDVPSGWSVHQPDARLDESTNSLVADFQVDVPIEAEFNCPYWLREAGDSYRYAWPHKDGIGLPLNPPQVSGVANFPFGGQQLRMRAEALSREAFGGGYRELPLSVLPPLSLAPESAALFLPTGEGARDHQLVSTVRCSQAGGAHGEVELWVPEGWVVSPERVAVDLNAKGDVQTVNFHVQIPATVQPGLHRLDYHIRVGSLAYSATLHPVRSAAPGLGRPADERTCIREVFITEPASVDVHLVDAEFVRKLKYGYIMGAAEDVVATLEHFDLDLGELDDDFLKFGDLSEFDTIVVGPNAYLLREALRTHGERLLGYLRSGGTVIVQYQGYGFEGKGFAPLPFRYHQPHDRVTFEDASVGILEKDHSILHVPNEITDADWEGWVKDRGMYFFGEYDDGYLPILECNDPGEEPQLGGLLVTDVGHGSWVYCAYSLWKQIPAGVPGGFRLFANLLGLPHSRILRRSHLLLGATLFEPMTAEERYDIARLMSDRRLEDGDILCRQGDQGDEMYVIVGGEIEIIKSTPAHPDGEIIAVAGQGDAIGELSVLASQPRSATMRARGNVRLLAIWGPAFRDLVHTNPGIADRLIGTLVDKLAATGDSS